jgi:hypothetical protein
MGEFFKKYKNLHKAENDAFFKLFNSRECKLEEKYKSYKQYLILSHIKNELIANISNKTEFDSLSFEELLSKFTITDTEFVSLPLEDQHRVLYEIALDTALQDYGFKLAAWHPNKPIEILEGILYAHGPLLIFGSIGRAYYEQEPTLVPNSEINAAIGQSIYGWKKGDAKREKTEGHAVIVIGAQKDGNKGGNIYFVDPLDESDPQATEPRPIYVWPYSKFIKKVGLYFSSIQNVEDLTNQGAYYWDGKNANLELNEEKKEASSSKASKINENTLSYNNNTSSCDTISTDECHVNDESSELKINL